MQLRDPIQHLAWKAMVCVLSYGVGAWINIPSKDNLVLLTTCRLSSVEDFHVHDPV